MTVTANSNITPQGFNAPAFGVLLSTAMTNTKAYEGTDSTGTALGLVFTFGANGSKVPDYVNISYACTTGATPSGTTNATVARIFLNNSSANTTAANNTLLGEITIPAATYSATSALPTYRFPLNGISCPASYRIYVGLATAVGATNGALAVNCPGGGDY